MTDHRHKTKSDHWEQMRQQEEMTILRDQMIAGEEECECLRARVRELEEDREVLLEACEHCKITPRMDLLKRELDLRIQMDELKAQRDGARDLLREELSHMGHEHWCKSLTGVGSCSCQIGSRIKRIEALLAEEGQ
jgi:hypothetical protein